MGRKKQRLRWLVPGQRLRRGNRKILNAAINVAAESLFVVFIRAAQTQRGRL
jgi:hypothetical protein